MLCNKHTLYKGLHNLSQADEANGGTEDMQRI